MVIIEQLVLSALALGMACVIWAALSYTRAYRAVARSPREAAQPDVSGAEAERPARLTRRVRHARPVARATRPPFSSMPPRRRPQLKRPERREARR